MTTHVVASITFGPRRAPASSLVCTCGMPLSASTPEALETLWQKHRVHHGLWGEPPAGMPLGPKAGVRFDWEFKGATNPRLGVLREAAAPVTA